MRNYDRKWRTKRDRFVEMLKPFLQQGWHDTNACCVWLKANSGWKSIPTAKELGTCIQRHPNIIQRWRKGNEWRWVE